ncbi:MAG: hypothetical protein QXZ44_05205 [Ferroplasma sp.]
MEINSNAHIRYLITAIGSILIILSGILALLFLFVAGIAGAGQLIFFNPAGFALVAGSILGAVIPIIWIILAYIMYSVAKNGKRKDKAANGLIIIVIGFIVLFIGGGFVIGPVLDIVGGFLLIL